MLESACYELLDMDGRKSEDRKSKGASFDRAIDVLAVLAGLDNNTTH